MQVFSRKRLKWCKQVTQARVGDPWKRYPCYAGIDIIRNLFDSDRDLCWQDKVQIAAEAAAISLLAMVVDPSGKGNRCVVGT